MLNAFRRFALALVAVCCAAGTGPEARAVPVAAHLSAAEQADLTAVERALNGVRTLQAHFLQIVENGGKGSQASGTFYMERPGRMRLVYDPPLKDFIVSDGWLVFYWDDELKQQSSEPLGSSLADFFLRADIKLSGDVTVTRVLHQYGTIEVSVVETGDPGKGELTLVFEDKPLQLRKWRVVDAQGTTTTVSLSDVRTGIPLKDDLFVFRDPSGSGKRPH